MLWDILKITLDMAVGAVEGAFWIGHGAGKAAQITADAWRARHALMGHGLRCPRGHVIGTTANWQCGECHWVWQGKPFFCPNPECPSPQTVYVNCDTCGLSVRSPYRWGSP